MLRTIQIMGQAYFSNGHMPITAYILYTDKFHNLQKK